jgi:hypothetical protein
MEKVKAPVAADGKPRDVITAGRAVTQRSHSTESQEYFECYDEYQPWHLEIIHSVPTSLTFHSANVSIQRVCKKDIIAQV